jgi:transcriptional regulator with XRE-family HTH domain
MMQVDMDLISFGALSDALQRVMPESPKTEAALRMLIAERLKEARGFNGLTQVEAAKRMGYANSTQISIQEKGDRMPPLGTILHAAAVYGVPVDFLLGLSDEPERDPRMAARIASLAATRSIVDSAVLAITDQVAGNLANSGLAQQVVDDAADMLAELVEAFAIMRRISGVEFDELRGGSRIERAVQRCQDMLPMINEARRGSAVNVVRNACRPVGEVDQDIKPMLRELMDAIRQSDDIGALTSLGGRAMAIGNAKRRTARRAVAAMGDRLQMMFPEMGGGGSGTCAN